ncbi:cupin domain-containing protein [Roseateles chitinivorans]|uniref:cupin domain-containing protein n=1 Tax=Roseateles chitinivorans TaxID=2917965 RepID=UPI003D67EAA1
MIIRKTEAQADHAEHASFGITDTVRLSAFGGLTQYGAYVQTLQPGARSSNRHWHENEDEMLYVLSGQVTITEGDREEVLQPGDTACWPAGAPIAHRASNQSDAPCTYMIVGTRVERDICHYPDTGRTLHREGSAWRLLEADGRVFKTGSF